MNNSKYDETISNSKAESLLKAISIWEAEAQEHTKKIHRPDIPVGKMIGKHILYFCIFLLLGLGLFWGLSRLELQKGTIIILWMALGLALLLLRFRSVCVDFVLLYQRLAPERIRRSCLFEPSCSEYMLLAIEKYGPYKGFFKGMKRVFRCHHPNGGVDYP